MAQTETLDALNELLAIHCRSLPRYLKCAHPWIHQGDQRDVETLEHIVADQDRMIERIMQAILDRDGQPDMGEFPMAFTDVHDLSLEYLVRRAVAHQKMDIARIEGCTDALRLAPSLLPLAEEALGLAKGHLETLEELVASKAG